MSDRPAEGRDRGGPPGWSPDLVDLSRGPTASQAAGLTLAAATRDLGPISQPGAAFYGYDSVAGGRTILFAGGMPLERDGVLAGALGVSGGDAEQDQRVADAGVRAFG